MNTQKNAPLPVMAVGRNVIVLLLDTHFVE